MMRPIPAPVEWRGDRIRILDQRALPHREEYLDCGTVDDVAEAIRSLAVRGAPILGVTAAFGVALAAAISTASDGDALFGELDRAGDELVATRPTARLTTWELQRLGIPMTLVSDSLAVLSERHRVPFLVVAPVSTIDPSTETGDDIVIEDRDPSEVTSPLGMALAPPDTPAANPAFDVTPAELVTAIVTERGVLRPPYAAAIRSTLATREDS
jgi:methylthioribose-1-phosphate isomerase